MAIVKKINKDFNKDIFRVWKRNITNLEKQQE